MCLQGQTKVIKFDNGLQYYIDTLTSAFRVHHPIQTQGEGSTSPSWCCLGYSTAITSPFREAMELTWDEGWLKSCMEQLGKTRITNKSAIIKKGTTEATGTMYGSEQRTSITGRYPS